MESNLLKSLPASFQYLINLELLQLGINDFISLPEWFGNLKNLSELDLGGNKFHALPETIGNLENLDWISLGPNKISILPESFRNLKKLTYVDLDDTGLRSFSNIPEELIDEIDPAEDSWPWPSFLSKGNYPSIQAKKIIDYNLYKFWEYYRVSPLELATKYAKDQDSITLQEKDRLSWEGIFRERQIIEASGVELNDHILAEINKRLTITCDNGLKLIK